MNNFLRQLITEWRRLQLPTADKTFVIAVSGGADSVSLLLALCRLREKKKLDLEFVAAHFNHALRGEESDKDEAFVKKLSEKLGIKFERGNWKDKKPPAKNAKEGENLEQAAREARYEFLGKTAEKYDAYGILTGHTIDDQAETFLMRLIRGSGPDGLGAMKPARRLRPGKNTALIRPLLDWARRCDTEEFCRLEMAGKIKFRNDAMNRNKAFLRVRIRREVLPLLQKINPQIVSNLAKTARVLQEETEASDIAAQACLVKMIDAGVGANNAAIDVKRLAELPPGTRKRVLRLWLEGRRAGLRRLGREHFRSVERLVLSGSGGKQIELPGGERVYVSKGRLIFKKTKVEKSPAEN